MSEPSAANVSEKPPRWAHALAVATALAALPLLTFGAEVTSHGVGMVDPKGFRWPWEIVPLWAEAMGQGNFGLFIELTHRLFGFLVGILAIALCVGLFVSGRGWKRWLGALALAAVITQGLLGRYRVDLHALLGHTLPLVHGCFAHLVFALLVSVAVWTSRTWNGPAPALASPALARVRHWSVLTAGLIYVQLVLGALVRHKDLPLGARAHLLGAFVVVAAVAWLVKLTFDVPARERQGGAGVVVLAALVTVQLYLGVESWLSKVESGLQQFQAAGYLQRQFTPLPVQSEMIRSAHYLVGALTFAAAVTAALLTNRQAGWAARTAPAPARRLEGAA
jgi:cytochrome c oxidase assembly protein subunit 15